MKGTVITAVAALALALGAQVVSAEGTSYSWNVSSGNWGEENCWTPSRQDPFSSDLMHVERTGGGTCVYNVAEQTVQAVYVERGDTLQHSTDNCTLRISGCTANSKGLYLGNENGTGTYVLSGANTSLIVHNAYGNAEVVLGNGSLGFFTQTAGVCQFDNLRVSKFYVPPYPTSTYTLDAAESGGLSVVWEYIGQLGSGKFDHRAGYHTVKRDLVIGAQSGSGEYEMTGGALSVGASPNGGSLEVGEEGPGQFLQDGPGSVSVSAGSQQGSGRLIVSQAQTGLYRINSANAALDVETAIMIGAFGGHGRFEWFSGAIDTPLMTLVEDPEDEEATSEGTLAMGFDFTIADLLGEVLFENDDYNAELAGLDKGTLEITNNAEATHEDPADPPEPQEPVLPVELVVGRLNIGDTTDAQAQLCGTYSFTGEFPDDCGPVVTTGSLFISLVDPGTINVGTQQNASTPKIVVEGKGDYEEDQSTLYASVYVGADSTLKAEAAEAHWTVTLTDAEANFLFKVGVADADDVDGLAKLELVFNCADASDDYHKEMEMAGVALSGENVPEAGDFDADNFLLGELEVGREAERNSASTYEKVKLLLLDETDNQDDGEDDEAVYVDILTITAGGTFATPAGVLRSLSAARVQE